MSVGEQKTKSAPPWKCEHGVYTGGLSGRSLYCSFCTPEGPPEDDSEVEPFAFWTCSACWRTKPIEQFPINPRTDEHAHACLDCAPPRKALNPNLSVAERKKEYGLRRRARHGDGDFTLEAWLQKCEQAGWLCSFCERALTVKTAICGRWIPASRGGTNDISNCSPSCKSCYGRFTASWRASKRLAA